MKTFQGCCTTRASIRYWAIVFVAALAPLVALSIYWRPLSAAAVMFAAGIACVANWLRNRTYHCGISGPILLIAGVVLLLASARVIHADLNAVGIIAIAGVAVSLLLEWRYATRSTGEQPSPGVRI
ncbi:MAG TPA: hypothetical protein VGI45_32150 [Terracidiphilus sp.]|jgi:hypothetical protein